MHASTYAGKSPGRLAPARPIAPERTVDVAAISGSVFVDVVAVLEVPVPVVHVVDVLAVLDCLAIVTIAVRSIVFGMDGLLRMALPTVDVVDVVTVRDGLATVARQVLVIGDLSVTGHEIPVLSGRPTTRLVPGAGDCKCRRPDVSGASGSKSPSSPTRGGPNGAMLE
ncbi:MAG: hypothetical protein QOH14_1865 [Pseudonocardiales bacterium]|jgi:hypothetical protein|nr:hypothetical protein [Pseudonocardiales bacterium]